MSAQNSTELSRIFSAPIALITLGGLFAINAVSLDGPIVAVPAISEQFSVGKGQAQLITSLFLLGYALAHIPIGLLGDRFGRRPVILIGMILTVILALGACFAPTLESLIAIRFLQGMATASGGLLSRAIVRDVSHGREAARLTSQAFSVLAVLIIIAPLLSGMILELLGWRYVFGLVFAYASGLTFLTIKYVPETFQTADRSVTPFNQLQSSVTTFFGSQQAVVATLLGSMVFATYFIFATIGASVMEDVYSKPASLFGILFALCAAVQLLGAQLNARLVKKWGVARMLLIAFALSFAGVLTCTISLFAGLSSLIVFVAVGCLFAMSHGMTLPNSIALTLDPLPREAGFAASLHGMVQSTLGASVSLIATRFYSGTSDNALMMFAIFGMLNLAAFVLYRMARRD